MAQDKPFRGDIHFTPTQVGYITDRIVPINIASDAKWTVNVSGGPDSDIIPVERHGVILGMLRREDLGKLAGSFLNRLLGKHTLSFLIPVQEVIDASSYINTVIERGLKTTTWDNPAWYVVEHKKKYLGVVNLRQMMEYTDGIRARDLLRAGEIQKNLLVQPSLEDARFNLICYNRMANEVGGDWYKPLRINKDLYLVGCFDVAGKNVSGSLVTMSLGACFATLELLDYKGNNPERISSLFNNLVRKVNPPDVFVAAALLYIDFFRGQVVIHNCGLSPVAAFVLAGENHVSYKIFKPNMPPLGLNEEIDPDPPQTMPISGGLRVVVYSDGLSDMCDLSGQRYGEERTMDFLQNLHFLDQENFASYVDREIDLWTKDTALADDITLFELRFGADSSAANS